MITLISIEMRRILARRLVHWTGLLVLAALVIAGIVVFARSHRPSAEELQADQERARVERQAELDACGRGEFGIPPGEIPPGMTLEEFCEEVVVGQPIVQDPRFHLTTVKDVLGGTSGILMALLMVLAASFIGAEWHAGTMGTLLTWEPRRVRVFVAKALAAGLFAFLAFLAVQALLAAVLAPAAALRGTTEGADPSWLASTAGIQLRAALMAGVIALFGLSLASIGRNTALALGVGFVYFSILEPLLRAVRPSWQPWLLANNVVTFVGGDAGNFALTGRSTLEAGLVVVSYMLALTLVAMELFRRRDVA